MKVPCKCQTLGPLRDLYGTSMEHRVPAEIVKNYKEYQNLVNKPRFVSLKRCSIKIW